MRYLSVFLSFFLHALIAIALLNTAFSHLESRGDHFDLELVSLPRVVEKKDLSRTEDINKKEIVQDKKQPKPDKIKKEKLKIKPVKKVKGSGRLGKISTQRNEVAPKSSPRQSMEKTVISQPVPAHDEIDPSQDHALILRQGKGITVGNTTHVLKRGSESRSMDSIAGYGFGENDFRGHYETSTGRQIVIIDAREEHGRLVLHDKKTGLTRKLKQAGYGDFIYTYGPSFDEDEPVVGSVIFLPGDEHWIHRFMWLPDDESAEYPVKGRVDTTSVAAENDERVFVPAKEGKYPAVILTRFGAKIPDGQFAEVARHLCGRGVVVLIVDDLSNRAVEDAFRYLAVLDKVDSSRIGLWVRGYRPQKIPRIPKYTGRLGFVALTIDCPAGSLYPERVASVIPDNVPTFIGFRNISVDWKALVPVMLTGFQSAPHKLTILKEASPATEEVGTDLRWIDSLSGDFVSSISAWLDSQ